MGSFSVRFRRFAQWMTLLAVSRSLVHARGEVLSLAVWMDVRWRGDVVDCTEPLCGAPGADDGIVSRLLA